MNVYSLFLACALSAMTTGCNENASIQKASSPPLLLGQIDHRGAISPYGSASDIRRAVASLGDSKNVHAIINTTDPRIAATTTAALVDAGVDAARIRHISDPSAQFVLRAYTLVLPECAGALRRSWFGDVSGSLTSLGMCTQARALGQELDNPGDLVEPAQLQTANGARFARVVELWEKGQETRDEKNTSSGQATGGGSAAAGGASTGSMSETASQSAEPEGAATLPPPPGASSE